MFFSFLQEILWRSQVDRTQLPQQRATLGLHWEAPRTSDAFTTAAGSAPLFSASLWASTDSYLTLVPVTSFSQ